MGMTHKNDAWLVHWTPRSALQLHPSKQEALAAAVHLGFSARHLLAPSLLPNSHEAMQQDVAAADVVRQKLAVRDGASHRRRRRRPSAAALNRNATWERRPPCPLLATPRALCRPRWPRSTPTCRSWPSLRSSPATSECCGCRWGARGGCAGAPAPCREQAQDGRGAPSRTSIPCLLPLPP